MVNQLSPETGPEIIVSVSIITYNQKEFVDQAIRGVLDQKVNFPYEVIIGDDFSTDGTREIIVDYQRRYPEIIKPILHARRNEGLPGKLNFLSTIGAARGKYIALLDGDDYWNDQQKLQTQVDFLESNPDYSICFHRVYDLEPGKTPVFSSINNPEVETTYTIFDLAKQNMIHTPSVVFRRITLDELPSWFVVSPVGDYVLHLLNANKGKIKYFPAPMAVYRKHIGIWSGLSQIQMWEKWLWVLEQLVDYFRDQPVEKDLKEHRGIILAALIAFARQRDKDYNDILNSPSTAAERLSGKSLLTALKYKVLRKLR